MTANQRPGSVTAIAIWLIVAGVFYALFALIFLLVQTFFASEDGRQMMLQEPEMQALPPEILDLMGPLFLGLGLISLVFAVICVVMSVGLFRLKGWGRMGTIIFHWVCIGLNAFQLLGSIFSAGTAGLTVLPTLLLLVFNLAIAGSIVYILQQPDVRQAFRPVSISDQSF
ncbi:hypothetical protein [Leptolyngbya sp. CCY15150]|uniref:hypothetical protein n=1 Tax=Leptolyngbya sp. CCY15150 TaxID=2767772 RepID=UPI00194E4301|nr:hypothetical protein [Leptolyngbya sp. CCY15150]